MRAASAFDFRPHWIAALGAEFVILGLRAAGGAERHCFARDTEIFRVVLLADFFFHLIDGRLHLWRGDLGLDIRSAGVAERALGVPAGRLAKPMGAFRTLAEISLRRFDGFAKSLVMRRSLDGELDLVAVGANGAENAAE